MSSAPPIPQESTLPPGLLFTLGGERCRLELSRLEGIAPWAELEPSDEPEMLGWLHRYGERVPVVDMNRIAYGEETERCLGSRILLLRCDAGEGRQRLVGVLASEVFTTSREGQDDAVQRFDPCDLLPASLRRLD